MEKSNALHDRISLENGNRNLTSSIKALIQQLRVTLEDGDDDFNTILQFCIEADKVSTSSEESLKEKEKVIQSLQYYDRLSQRVNHVMKRLNSVVDYISTENSNIELLGFEDEMTKAISYYDKKQTDKIKSEKDNRSTGF